VVVDSNNYAFQLYQSGIFADSTCGTTPSHTTNIVGWNVDTDGTEYWIMRNSWSTKWGYYGYMYVAITDGVGYCAIQYAPSYPTVTGP